MGLGTGTRQRERFVPFLAAGGFLLLLLSGYPLAALAAAALGAGACVWVHGWRKAARTLLLCALLAGWAAAVSLLGGRGLDAQGVIDALPKAVNLRALFMDAYASGPDGETKKMIALMLFNSRDASLNPFYGRLVDLGVVHLFVVSGMHLSVLGGFVRRLVPKRFKWRAWAGFFAALAYALLLGMSAGVMRVVFGLFRRALHMDKGDDAYLEETSSSGLLMLCLNPWFALDLGFELSYLACLALAISRRYRGVHKFVLPLLNSFVINLLVGPISLAVNGQINLLAVFWGWLLSPLIAAYYLLSLLLLPLPFA